MLDDSGLIDIRSRELKIRLLDLERVKKQRTLWSVVNTVVPVVMIVLLGILNYFWRRRKYLS